MGCEWETSGTAFLSWLYRFCWASAYVIIIQTGQNGLKQQLRTEFNASLSPFVIRVDYLSFHPNSQFSFSQMGEGGHNSPCRAPCKGLNAPPSHSAALRGLHA